MKSIIVDLDGTLANVDHRVHHVQSSPKQWKSFHDKMTHDSVNTWCASLIANMKKDHFKIILMTAREESYRQHTLEWLDTHQIEFDELYMKPTEDQRNDADIKESLYRDFVEGSSQVLFVLEDRKSVVERWREIGLTCLQCARGDF